MNHTRYKLFGSIVCILLLSGCAMTRLKPDSLRVSLVDIKIREVKLFETSLRVEIRIFNANDVSIPLKGLDCKLQINGKDFAFGVSNKSMEIPALGSVTLPIEVYSSMVEIVKGLINIKDKEELKYNLSGRIHLGGEFPSPTTIPFKTEGRLVMGGAL